MNTLPHVAMFAATSFFTSNALAQAAGDTIFNLGWFHIMPNDSSETLQITEPKAMAGPVQGSSASVGKANTLAFSLTHFMSDHLALTLDAGLPPKFKLTGQGSLSSLGELGTAKQWSPALIGKWYFGNAQSAFRPFVGAGVTYIRYSNIQLTSKFQSATTFGGTATADLSSSWAPVANIGATYNFDKNWSMQFSLSYVPLKTDAVITGKTPDGTQTKAQTRLTLDPLVALVSVGYKF